MSIMHFDAISAASALGIELSLSGGNVNDRSFKNAQAGFRFNSDGTVDRLNSAGQVQINSATDWVEPGTTFTAADYEIKWHENFVLSEGGDDPVWVSNTWDEDEWLPLSSNRTVQYEAFSFSFGDPEYIELGDLHEVGLSVVIRYQDGSNAARNPVLDTFATAATALTIGDTYEITSVGTSDFTIVGASANTVGIRFTATGTSAGGDGICKGTCAVDSGFFAYSISLTPYG